MSRLVAIHQPNFFPWLGYFDKIRRADAFIFLDAVDYPRAGSGGMGSYTNRVRLYVQGEARWVTCPVRRLPSHSPISSARIDDAQPWRVKLMRTIEANYRSAARYDDAIALLEPLIRNSETSLAAFNVAAIRAVSARLGLHVRFFIQSELEFSGAATSLLVSLVKAVGGDAYLAGGGASGYQDDALFAAEGLRLVRQDFVPAPYGNPERFLPGLSVIDYLMHDGRPLSDAIIEASN